MKIGITGQAGFVGTHLFNTLSLDKEQFKCVPFEDTFFEDESKLRTFVKSCDAIVHLAAMNRHPDPKVIYKTNIKLVQVLIQAMEDEKVTPHILFSSSTQEELDNEYGKSKKDGRTLFENWAKRNKAPFTGLVVPNVYGAFGKPNYNSFIATFCHKLTHGETPQIIQDGSVKLIYVGSLCRFIMDRIGKNNKKVERVLVPYDFEKRVSEVLDLLESYKKLYLDKGIIPQIQDVNELNLFNTFRSYIEVNHFPVNLVKHIDSRGSFVEIIRLGTGGQVSFSTTVSGITRGEHFHTRKIERFTVIKGKARIQLRKIGTNEVIEYFLDGESPAYVDMPIWYTHNITNVGEEELYTQFWINEWYNPDDSDTYFEKVVQEKETI